MGGDRIKRIHREFQGRLTNRTGLALLLCLGVFVLAACGPGGLPVGLPAAAQPLATITPTTRPTETLTPTATIVWFPPTATYTPFPTRGITPTPDLSPVYGELIFSDDFSDSSLWQVSKTSSGTIAVGANRLNIAINQPRLLLSSVRAAPEIGSYYLEITARANLCSGEDEYGLLFRYASASDFLRYSVSCSGQARLDKITSGEASSPQPWTLSGAFAPGAPNEVRLGVHAQGKALSFYINDIFQFSVNEPGLLSGLVGVFARSASNSPVSISFSDLAVYQPKP